MKALITGGAGFIGSNFTKYMLTRYPHDQFIIVDKLTYAGNLNNLKEIAGRPNYRFVRGDVCDLKLMLSLLKSVDCVFHTAAESHVDNSIGNSLVFTKSNAYGTHVLLEAARICSVGRIIHVSTDEVYGDIMRGSSKESDKLEPNNPYSASKAAAEMIARAYYKTYGLPIIVTRGNNTYGPYQYPEKLLSRFITNLIQDKTVPLHGDGSNVRTYIHVDDVCSALDAIYGKGKAGEIYNIGTKNEFSNLELTRILLQKFGKDESYIEHVADRPFNDRRYSVDTRKLEALGWKKRVGFHEGIRRTIQWYKENKDWWMPLLKRM